MIEHVSTELLKFACLLGTVPSWLTGCDIQNDAPPVDDLLPVCKLMIQAIQLGMLYTVIPSGLGLSGSLRTFDLPLENGFFSRQSPLSPGNVANIAESMAANLIEISEIHRGKKQKAI